MADEKHVFLKDGQYEDKLSRAKFLNSLASGFAPDAAARRANLPLRRFWEDVEAGDQELKEALVEHNSKNLAMRTGVSHKKFKMPSTTDIRNLSLQVIAPRVLEHLSTRLDELDPSPTTNPENWQKDQELLMKCASMVTQLLPKEVITDNTHRKDQDAANMSSEDRSARIQYLQEKRKLLRGERDRAKENNENLVEFHKEEDPPEQEEAS